MSWLQEVGKRVERQEEGEGEAKGRRHSHCRRQPTGWVIFFSRPRSPSGRCSRGLGECHWSLWTSGCPRTPGCMPSTPFPMYSFETQSVESRRWELRG